MTDEKECRQCHETKALCEYAQDRRRDDGHFTRCRVCCHANLVARRSADYKAKRRRLRCDADADAIIARNDRADAKANARADARLRAITDAARPVWGPQ